MKVKAEYQGVVLTERVLQVHFRLTIGEQVVRHHHVKIPISELTHEVFAQAMDKAARRRLLEIWSDQPLEGPPWDE